MTDQSGTYFYNVKIERSWDILNCFNSEPRKFAKDRFEIRTDRSGAEITGLPLGVGITEYRVTTHGKDMCHLIRGEVKDEQILLTDGSTRSCGASQFTFFTVIQGATDTSTKQIANHNSGDEFCITN